MVKTLDACCYRQTARPSFHACGSSRCAAIWDTKNRGGCTPNQLARFDYNLPVRKVVLGLGISLDGYIARPNGAVDFLFMPKDYSMAPFFATIDTAIMGRKTLDVALKMGGGSISGSSMVTYVFSRSKPPGERDGLLFVNQSPAALVRQLRNHPGKNIWLMGGGELARDFLKADLVDELYLGIVPVLLGRGIPLFPSPFPQREFKLVENKTYSRGLIALKYERIRRRQQRSS
jgi:dihydrofolate reductase